MKKISSILLVIIFICLHSLVFSFKMNQTNPFTFLLQDSDYSKSIPSNKKLQINSFLSFMSSDKQPLLSSYLPIDLICTGCQSFVSLMNNIPSQQFISIINTIIVEFCAYTKQVEEVCAGAVDSFEPYVINSFKTRYLSSEFICGESFHVCSDTYEYLNSMDYVNEILKGKPNKTYPYPTVDQVKKTYKILHLTDPHVDMEYEVGSNAYCDQPLCCLSHSGAAPNTTVEAHFWGTDSNCDLPSRTFEAFAQFVEKHLDVDFVLWTGDNMSHDIWHQNASRNLNSTVLTTETLKKYFKDIPVFPTIGNHEPFPVNVYDFHDGKNQFLIDGLTYIWQDWLGVESIATFTKNGFYSYYIQEKNLKILALHTQACNYLNFYFIENPTDPGNMLEWLHSELQSAEDSNQTVFIIGHIASGTDCLPEWSIRFKALIDRYSYVIRGKFFGHIHSEDFKVSKSFLDNSTIGLTFIPGSLTTYSNLFPEFRVYEIDSDTNLPVDYYQYRLNLTKYNEIGNTTEEILFDNVYKFTEEYNLPDMSFKSFDILIESLKTDINVIQKYIYNEGQGSPFAQKSADAATLETGFEEYCNKFDSVQEVEECLNSKTDIENIVIRYLTGKWRK